jgi:hypothetical protein
MAPPRVWWSGDHARRQPRCQNHCGGNLKIIAAIEEPALIERILTHLGCARSRRHGHRRSDAAKGEIVQKTAGLS